MGAHALERPQGGRGMLLGGIAGVAPAKVVVLGGGIVGYNAALIAVGMQADVWVLDRSIDRMRELDPMLDGRATIVMSTTRRGRARARGRRSRDRRGARAGRARTEARDPRDARPDAPRLGARRRRDRPGRLLRDVARDDALRSDVRRRRRRPLLRREHARRGADQLDAGAHERDAARISSSLPTVASSAPSHALPALARGVSVVAGQVTSEPVAEALGHPFVPLAELVGNAA